MRWDPSLYARFADHRLRPALDLLARVPVESVDRVVDLGCGTGAVTRYLVERWPGAEVWGVDGSREMLDEARRSGAPGLGGVRFEEADLSTWRIDGGADVIYSNATLHWLGEHEVLFPRLLRQVRAGGVLAVQMPRNFGAPSHQIASALAGSVRWRARLAHLVRPAPVADPGYYYELLRPLVDRLEMWETEYIQVLHGERPVLQWIKGTWLRQFLELLDAEEADAFEREYGERVADAYPMRCDGTTILPFRRLFMVASR